MEVIQLQQFEMSEWDVFFNLNDPNWIVVIINFTKTTKTVLKPFNTKNYLDGGKVTNHMWRYNSRVVLVTQSPAIFPQITLHQLKAYFQGLFFHLVFIHVQTSYLVWLWESTNYSAPPVVVWSLYLCGENLRIHKLFYTSSCIL